VDVAFNGLSGSLPTEIGLLSKLELMLLYGNVLTGTIPSELGQTSTLEYVNLSDNDLTEPVTVPPEIDQTQVIVNV
jgi:Leucine-rich repeat (LRR) protein